MTGYDFTNKTPEQLLRDLQTFEVHGSRGADTFDMAGLAIAVRVADANERAADAAARCVRLSAISASASAIAAIAAVIVGVLG